MEWSPQQHDALEQVRRWLDTPRADHQVFRLFGYAGTGKTTLAIEIAKMVRGDCLFATFTGKAALVMARKGCYGARTIHSLIYKVREDPLTGEIRFQLDKDSPLAEADLLIIDECSMVNEEIGKDLLSFEVPILVLGDPAQLPPVSGAGFFTEGHEPDVMLTEIHRQAAGNPIIQLATNVRMGRRPSPGNYRGDGGTGALSVMSKDDVGEGSMLGADQILCGTNATRRGLNAQLRAMLRREGRLPLAPAGVPVHMPVLDDRVICLKNKRDRGLLNGGIWRITAFHDRKPEAKKPGRADRSYLELSSCDFVLEGMRATVPHAFWEGTEDKLDKSELRNNDEFDYAYAITCHKSQGSQWDKVLVYDQGFVFSRQSEDMPRRWLYTAITRAAEKLIVAL